MDDAHIRSILEIMDPSAGFSPWHGGPTLMGCLRNVKATMAAWKPAADRHSIWELALHIAYWKYIIRRRLNPESPEGFARSPANWPEINDTSDAAWKTDKELIKDEHEKLNKLISGFPATRLEQQVADMKSDWTYDQLIMGIMAHDIYHIGQIQIMKRLYVSLKGAER